MSKKITKITGAGSSEIIAQILELNHLCHRHANTRHVLNVLVEKIAEIMKTDVASIYLIDPISKELVLRATKGLEKSKVDQVRLNQNEGLVGKTIEWLKPVSVAKGQKSKNYKFIPDLGEEHYESFLSVPLIHNRQPIGVLVVQNKKAIKYTSEKVHLFMMLAIPAVNVIENAKLSGTFDSLLQSDNEEISSSEEKVFQGVAASSGVAIGKVKFIKQPRIVPISNHHKSVHVDLEKMRLLEAFRWVEEEISHVQKKATKKFGMEELSIFDAYKMVIESQPFKNLILEEIESGQSALQAVEIVINKYTEQLLKASDEYIKERAYDVQDVGRKITDRLIFGDQLPKDFEDVSGEFILFSDNWSISDFVELDFDQVLGMMSSSGGATSHVSILAQSLGVPAVLGLTSFKEKINEGDLVILDGTTGQVIVNPTRELLRAYEREVQQNFRVKEKFKQLAKKKKAAPIGGEKITVGANVGIASHTSEVLDFGADEIGLYRSEFPFLMSRSLPTEEEQTQHYVRVLKSMGNKPVTIRTLDIGGDKYLPYLNLPKEDNPFLGWRAIRLSLDREDLFRIQLRALYRASVFGKLRILFPMITSLEEIIKVKEIISDVKQELKSQGYAYTSNVPLGIMIEVPSAVDIAGALIEHVQFFSIGTNDLTQYLLAVDRNNHQVSKLYNPLHPSVLRSIFRVTEAVRKAEKRVSVCGDMAGDPFGLVLLLGMGIDSISVSGPDIPKIKSLISGLDSQKIKRLTKKILKMNSFDDIHELIYKFFEKNNLFDYLPVNSDLQG